MKVLVREKIWNILSMLTYAVLVVLLGRYLDQNAFKLEDISVWEWIILALATFRLTRMILYDRVFKFLRDWIKPFSRYGLILSLRSLFTCPWCAGVWVALIIFVLYRLVPYGDVFVYLLSIAAVGTLIQLVSGLMSLTIEKKEMDMHQNNSPGNEKN